METEALPATQRTALFPLGHTAPQHSQPRKDRVLRPDLDTGGLGGGYSMELSKGPVPCVARECPCPSLIPQARASSNKQPSASTGLKHLGPVCGHLAYVEANP